MRKKEREERKKQESFLSVLPHPERSLRNARQINNEDGYEDDLKQQEADGP